MHHLPGILGRSLGVEFQEDSTDKVGLALPVLVLLGLDLGNELGQVLTSVCDGVDLLSDEELEAVRGTVLGVAEVVNAFSSLVGLLALFSLDAVLVGVAGELDFASFELQSGLVPIVNELLQVFAVGRNPCMLNAREELEQGSLGEVLGDVCEENGLGRQATGAPGRATVGLTEVDGEEGFSGDDEHDQAQEDKGY